MIIDNLLVVIVLCGLLCSFVFTGHACYECWKTSKELKDNKSEQEDIKPKRDFNYYVEKITSNGKVQAFVCVVACVCGITLAVHNPYALKGTKIGMLYTLFMAFISEVIKFFTSINW